MNRAAVKKALPDNMLGDSADDIKLVSYVDYEVTPPDMVVSYPFNVEPTFDNKGGLQRISLPFDAKKFVKDNSDKNPGMDESRAVASAGSAMMSAFTDSSSVGTLTSTPSGRAFLIVKSSAATRRAGETNPPRWRS